MTKRITRPTVSALSLVGLALFLGLLVGRPELFLVAVPLVVLLLSSALETDSPDYGLTHEVSADRVFEGDRLTVTITVTARSRVRLMELVEPLPPMVKLASGQNRTVLALDTGQRVRWTYTLQCLDDTGSPLAPSTCGSGTDRGSTCWKPGTSRRNACVCTRASVRSGACSGLAGRRRRWATTSPQPSAKGWSPETFARSRRVIGSSM